MHKTQCRALALAVMVLWGIDFAMTAESLAADAPAIEAPATNTAAVNAAESKTPAIEPARKTAGATKAPAHKLTKKAGAPPADRWEPSIRAFEAQDQKSPVAPGGIVFVGSSSIRMWDLDKSFPDLAALNRGFGGSQMADAVRYANRIVTPYRPRVVVLYAGDNDLAAGKSPAQVLADYRQFVSKIHAALPDTRIVYLGVKPSIARWKLIDKIRATNDLIREFAARDPRLVFVDVEKPMLGADGKPRAELFLRDGLHLNAEGYRIWADLLRPHLNRGS